MILGIVRNGLNCLDRGKYRDVFKLGLNNVVASSPLVRSNEGSQLIATQWKHGLILAM